jgi:hypothetical protein
MSNAEIGLIMGRTEGAIKSLYHRTLSTLREDLVGPLDDGEVFTGGVPGLADPEVQA